MFVTMKDYDEMQQRITDLDNNAHRRMRELNKATNARITGILIRLNVATVLFAVLPWCYVLGRWLGTWK